MASVFFDWIRESAQKRGSKTAYTDIEHSLTFSEIERLSAAVATWVARRSEIERPVAVMGGRNVYTPACYMGVARAGCFYAATDPEVPLARIEQIISEYYAIKPKTKQRKLARERIRQEFHIVGNKYPHWIQSPEWPMGEKSPMMYVSRSKGKDPDAVEFHFMDVDTGETRTIEQFY